MKKKWLILIVIVVLICLILIFLPQLFVKYVIERPLENIIGAKVVVHGLKFDLFKLGFNLGGIEIANPKDTWRNLFETKGIYFRLEGKPLLSGMIVVENVGIDQLRVDTPRKTDGKLDRPIPPMSLAAITNLEQSIPPVPVLSSDLLNHPPNVNNLINAHRFLIDSTAESIHSDLQTKKEELRKQITSGAESINEKANYIKGEYNRIIGLTLTPQQQIESLNNLKRTIPAVKNLIDTQRSSIEREIDSFKDQIDGLGRQAEADIRAIQAKVGLPNLDVDLSKALFGKLLLDQSIPYIELGERLRKLKFYQPPNPNIPIEKPNFPKFVIKKVTLSAGGSPGTVTE